MSGRRRRANIGRSTVNARRARSARNEESSTEREARLSQLRDRNRTERERESSIEREARRSQDRVRRRVQRARESSVEHEARLSQNRNRIQRTRESAQTHSNAEQNGQPISHRWVNKEYSAMNYDPLICYKDDRIVSIGTMSVVCKYCLALKFKDESKLFQLDGKKFCFTIIGDICHNDFNQMSTADDLLLSFMESWSSRKVLEDTLLVVMGDHGSRFSKLRETYHGKLEERLPLLSIFLPEKLKRLRPDAVAALNENIERLTTPFDLHTTVLDVLDLKDLSNMYTIPGCNLPRALSLLTPIPASRSCADAGIAQHWCTCTKWQSVDASSPMYNRVANALAEYINSLTSELRSKCENRQMTFVKSVMRQKVDDQVLKYVNYKEEDAFFGNPQMSAPKAPSEYYTATLLPAASQAYKCNVSRDIKNSTAIIAV
ncbi:unnamed protein product [Spodoptera exigua]|nr:unnamed protein product [Spodoptera exigua]